MNAECFAVVHIAWRIAPINQSLSISGAAYSQVSSSRKPQMNSHCAVLGFVYKLGNFHCSVPKR